MVKSLKIKLFWSLIWVVVPLTFPCCTCEADVFEVLATAGDTHLGGEDFDESLMAHVQKTCPNADSIFNDDKSKRKLRTACEKAKRELSITQSAKLECFVGEHEVNMTISRDEFNKVNEPTFKRCLEAVKRVLADAGRDKSLVNEIVLVGGSTRVPRVQEILTQNTTTASR